MPTVRLENVTKFFKFERKKHMAVQDINLTIEQGEFVFLNGSSGAGKSTVLRLLCGEISPDRGTAYLDNTNISHLFGPWQIRLRRTFGVVWQEPRLIRKMNIYNNLLQTARAGGLRSKSTRAVAKALALVGMQHVEQCYPAELTLSDIRHVELARALVCSPPILLLDELTANLDDDSIWDIFHLLMELNNKGITIVMITHASRYVNIMRKRVITLVDGQLVGDIHNGRYAQTTASQPKIIFKTSAGSRK